MVWKTIGANADPTPMLRITDNAAELVRAIAAKRGVVPVLRVRAIGGGCAGLTWDVSLGDDAERPGDVPRTTEGVKVVVDAKSAPRLRGAFVDVGRRSVSGLRQAFAEGETDLVLANITSRRPCSCGESFEP
jgi:iron-sulfur cluster assembly accessory protein